MYLVRIKGTFLQQPYSPFPVQFKDKINEILLEKKRKRVSIDMLHLMTVPFLLYVVGFPCNELSSGWGVFLTFAFGAVCDMTAVTYKLSPYCDLL